MKAWCHPLDFDTFMCLLPAICKAPHFTWSTNVRVERGTIWIDDGQHRRTYKAGLVAEQTAGPQPLRTRADGLKIDLGNAVWRPEGFHY